MNCQSFFQVQEEWFSVEVPVHDGKLREHIWANMTVDIENNGRQVLVTGPRGWKATPTPQLFILLHPLPEEES